MKVNGSDSDSEKNKPRKTEDRERLLFMDKILHDLKDSKSWGSFKGIYKGTFKGFL